MDFFFCILDTSTGTAGKKHMQQQHTEWEIKNDFIRQCKCDNFNLRLINLNGRKFKYSMEIAE